MTIPDSVASIGDYAFRYCESLTNVTIPDSVTIIGESAFDGCSGLTSVTIPDSVTSIGECAFYDCSGLTNVTMKGDAPSVGSEAFANIGENAVVRLPIGSSGYDVDGDGKWQGMTVEWYEPVKNGYEAWAEENGITGAWDATSGGIHNVFRYVFGVPEGDLPAPIIDIALEDGQVVVKTPPVANLDGVTVSVVEYSDLACKTVTATKAVDAAGSTTFTKSDGSMRFYRLKADATEE